MDNREAVTDAEMMALFNEIRIRESSWSHSKEQSAVVLKFGQELLAKAQQPSEEELAELCRGFGWRADGDKRILLDRIAHHIRDMKASIGAYRHMLEQPSETVTWNAAIEAAAKVCVEQHKRFAEAIAGGAAYGSMECEKAIHSLMRPAAQEAEKPTEDHEADRWRYGVSIQRAAQEAAREQPADERKDAIPELRNIIGAHVQGDFAVHVEFRSCRAASEFAAIVSRALAEKGEHQ
ncbi:MAG TPA: hypothetical protein VM406_16475 [Noviherbaspirillum sp.]|nr:hypothetical protein [Noviherbaspirillum sp.]